MTPQNPPSLVEYRDLGVELYRGNPLIEALPPILSTSEAMAALARYPAYSGKDRIAPSHLRIHQLNNVLQFFQPLPVHIDLEQRVSRMIRSGYVARNPLQIRHWREIDERVGAIRNARELPSRLRSTADGFGIIGISGGGKTTAINEVLRLYPQVLVHSNYQGRTFSRIQLAWLKLECPFDGSVRGLCLNFFDAVDSILQTEYLSAYTSGRQTVDELLPAMARVASLHSLGALVIDEVQHLSHSKSGGPAKMLNFFVQLVNTIGVPVILIGTYKAMSVLSSEFRQIRRASGQGDFIWERLKNDEVWLHFVETLWRYQYVQQRTPLTRELSDALYDECQGIVDFAVKLYLLAQARAISTGDEKVGAQIIRSVAYDSLRLAKPVLQALRNNDLLSLRELGDIHPIDFNHIIANEARPVSTVAISPPTSVVPAPAPTIQTSEVSPAPRGARPEKKAKVPPQQGSLLALAEAGRKKGLSAHDVLLSAKLIRSATDLAPVP